MSVIVYHVRKHFERTTININAVNNTFDTLNKKLNEDVILESLTNKKDIINYILSKSNSRMRKLFLNKVDFTLAFSFDKETNKMFVGWSKCMPNDKYSKKIASITAIKRCERIKMIYTGKKNDFRTQTVPTEIYKTIILEYYSKAAKYFKEANEVTGIRIY